MSDLYHDQNGTERFVRACLVSRWDPEQIAVVVEASRDPLLDWDAVRELAYAARVAPLLYFVARELSSVPEPLLQEFHSAYLRTALKNTLRLEEFSAVSACFAAKRLPIAALKGLALLEPIYGNIALRPMIDLDILVHRDNVLSALSLLKDLGYEPISPELAPQTTLEFENELLLRKRDGIEWHIELHWSLFNSPYYQRVIPESDLWNAMRPAVINGQPCDVLSIEWQVLHLCGHLMLHHGGAGLLWWNDIAELIHRKGKSLDWYRLVDLAGAYDLRLSAKTVLSALANEWGVFIPPDTLEALEVAGPTLNEQEVFRRLTAHGRLPARRLIDDLAGLGGWTDRATFMRHNLFPSAAYMDLRYGISSPLLRPFYYFRRWLRGAATLLSIPSTYSPVLAENQTPHDGDIS